MTIEAAKTLQPIHGMRSVDGRLQVDQRERDCKSTESPTSTSPPLVFTDHWLCVPRNMELVVIVNLDPFLLVATAFHFPILDASDLASDVPPQ